MRAIFILLDFIFIVFISFFVIQSEKRLVESLIDDILKDNNILCEKIVWKRLDNFLFENIYYNKNKIVKSIDIDINYLSLLKGKIGFDLVDIKNLNINNIQKIKIKKDNNSFISLPIEIDNIKLNAFYKFDNKNNKIVLNASKIDINRYINAKVDKLKINSFLADLEAKGDIKNNILSLNGDIFVNDKYLKNLYKDINYKKIEPIKFSSKIDKEKIYYKLLLKSKDLLKKLKDINLDLIYSGNYYFSSNKLQSNLIGKIIYKNSKAYIKSKIVYDKRLYYNGNGEIKNIPHFSKNLKEDFYKTFFVGFNGDLEKIFLNFHNKYIKINGLLEKKEELNFSFKSKKIYFDNILKNKTTYLKDGFATIEIDGFYKDYINLSYIIKSNLVDINGRYKEKNIDGIINISKNSILENNKKIDIKKLFPINFYAKFNQKIDGFIKNSLFFANFDYKNSSLNANININETKISISGDPKYNLKATVDIASLKNLLQKIEKIMHLPKIPIDAHIKSQIGLNMQNLSYSAKIESPWIIYEYDKYRFLAITYLNLQIVGNPKNITINYYAFTLPNHGFYATKNSVINLTKSKIEIKEFWIEDKIKITGFYTFDNIGKFKIKTSKYRYSSIEGVANFDANLKVNVDNLKVYAEGEINIYNAKIAYNPTRIRTVEDDDIIIVDKEEDYKKSAFFKENVALNVHIINKKPIIYEIKDLKAKINNDITIWKEYQKDLEILGQLVVNEGIYNYGNKIFKIKKSEIDFYGLPTNPFLNIQVEYEKDPYIIYIHILGDVENPIITFESEPYLAQNDILALILFDSKLSSLLFKTASGDKFTGILSNLFIKDLVKSFGLKLDKFSLITSGSRIGFEIGKKIADKITILYKNDEISTIVIRYKTGKNLQSEVTITPNKNSIDLYYKIEK